MDDSLKNKISLVKSRLAELIARKESAPVRLELYWIARDLLTRRPWTIASSVGIDRQIRFLKRYYDTKLLIPRQGERVSVSEVYRLCCEGDPLCTKVVDNVSEAMASLIMNMVRVSDPDTVILAGEMQNVRSKFITRLCNH